MEAFGRALALEPYLATVVLGGGFLRRASDAVQSDVLPKVAAGETLLAFAHTERQSRYDLADVATTAKKDGAGYVLDGAKSLVLHGDVADKLIVSARLSGDQRSRSGIGLFLVDAKAPGVSRRGYGTIDGLRAADVTLDKVKVMPRPCSRRRGQRLCELIEQVVDSGIAALVRRGGRRDERDA